MYLPFQVTNHIDTPLTEFLESDESITRTPRQWVRSLCSDDGTSLETDLENGGITEGHATMTVPSIHRDSATRALTQYWQSQNPPTLSHASKLYTESLLVNPDIPKTVFTTNIDTILARKVTKLPPPSASGDDTASVATPASSLTGTTAVSKGSKLSIAWAELLQATA